MKKMLTLCLITLLTITGCSSVADTETTTTETVTETTTSILQTTTATQTTSSIIETIENTTNTSETYNFEDRYYESVKISAEIDDYKQIFTKIKSLNDDIDKFNYLNSELDLNNEYVTDYKSKISEYVSTANNGYAQYSYATHLSTVHLLSEDDSIVVSSDEYLRTKRKSIDALGKQLINTVNDCLKDNYLSKEDLSIINNIKEQIIRPFIDIESVEKESLKNSVHTQK